MWPWGPCVLPQCCLSPARIFFKTQSAPSRLSHSLHHHLPVVEGVLHKKKGTVKKQSEEEEANALHV